MPSAAVDAAFQAKLSSGWSASVVIDGNTVTEPPENEIRFLIVQYPIQDGSKPSLGRRFFEEGVARLVLNVQTGTGLSSGLALADQLASLFRETNLGNGVQTFAPSAPIVNDTNDEGNWFSFSVLVPYRYQFDDGSGNSPA